jgi:mono/diheme cytochrome c family protein
MRRIFSVTLPVVTAAALVSAPLAAQDGASLFTENCAPCHNIGDASGAGPDLRDIAKRRDREWLLRYVLDPTSKNKAATMPPADLPRDAVRAILDYVDRQSAAAPVAVPAPAEPVFTAEDVAQGREFFTGVRRLTNRGPACVTCHDAGLRETLGGGTLGPDLTRLTTRLNGPKGTAAWLASPRTGVMRSVFGAAPMTPPEVQALTAFFVDRAQPNAPASRPRTLRFVALGMGGAAVIVLIIGIAGRDRLRPVRRRLLEGAGRVRVTARSHSHGFRSGGRR